MNRQFFLWTLLSAVVLLGLSSCKNKDKGDFVVSGSFKNADRMGDRIKSPGAPVQVYLQELATGMDQAPVILDSARLSGNSGSFRLSGAGKKQTVYELVFGENTIAVPLVEDAAEIRVNVDLGKKDDFYEVSGSDASAKLKDLIIIFGRKYFEVERRSAEVDSLRRSNISDTSLTAVSSVNARNNAIQDLNTYLKQFINTNENPTVSALALSWANRTFSPPDFESSLNSLLKKFPTDSMILGVKKQYEQQQAQEAEMRKRQEENSWVGKQAPEFSLPDRNGKMISLSSFKGKYLLVDFWASWCGPCRGENPNVVKAYQEFKGKNFDILGVSLDKAKEPWEQAIKEDKLDWNHVSDLKYWNSDAVRVFKFEGIPFNVLIDPHGKIIAESLRGVDLENKLRELLN